MALVVPFGGKRPRVSPDAYLAPTAVLVGDVSIGSQASVWFGAVLRGDDPHHGIGVGPRSSIQDNCVIHVGDWQPTIIGADVTVGHGAKMESCTIEDGCVIGMNAVILQRAKIGTGSLIAANSVVLEGSIVPPRSVVAGVPGKVRKHLSGSAAEFVRRGSAHYVELSRTYRQEWAGAGPRCEVCGGEILARHGKLVCLDCGQERDRTDRQAE